MKNFQSEAEVKDDIKAWLYAHRIYNVKDLQSKDDARGFYWMPVQTGFGITGVPDFVLCFCGMLVVVETKAGNKRPKPSTHQLRFIEAVHTAGGKGVTVNSAHMFAQWWIKEVDDKHYLYFPSERGN